MAGGLRKTAPVACLLLSAMLVATAACAAATVPRREYLPVPSLCTELVSSEPGKVFLKNDLACEQAPAKLMFEIDASRSRLEIFVNGEKWRDEELSPFSQSLVDDLRQRAEQVQVAVPENPHAADARQKAGQMLDADFDERIAREAQRVQREVLGDLVGGQYPDLGLTPASGAATLFSKKQRLYLLVSSSMPLATLRTYAAQVDALATPSVRMITRGLIGGAKKLKPTLLWALEVKRADPGCDYLDESNGCEFVDPIIDVDATLFRRFGIDQVPAFVFVDNVDSSGAWNEGVEDAVPMGAAYVTQGDASLEEHLSRLHAASGAPELKEAIKALRTSPKLKRFYQAEQQRAD